MVVGPAEVVRATCTRGYEAERGGLQESELHSGRYHEGRRAVHGHKGILGVTQSDAKDPFVTVNCIQAMICSFVFTSGAGTSFSGPMKSNSSAVGRGVIRFSSPIEILFG